ncbi:MAG: SIR2 family protein [Paraglaciecola sp.]|uniref:SIR2 family protein n=1 Tax=Paraglaciecola sp. TaxID=1920173 RepID=UPI0032984A9C
MKDLICTLDNFLNDFQLNGNHLMWFLGAGASRSANLPTASDLTWDLKKRIYCANENRNFDAYDLNSEAVKAIIQRYMVSKGYPDLWSDEEYSFYFELFFGSDYRKQQQYIESVLKPERISLNVGHRVFAALINLNIIRIAFTTNFDPVVELAYSKVAGENLNVFSLDGSYAALDALNNESYPIYSKLHGDFRYQSIKNLSEDLLANDEQLKRCFVSTSNRFGMVVTGYSGRDGNVMQMFDEALHLPNAFPKGIFWTVPNVKFVEQKAIDFIQKARSKGVNAFIVETGTFDELLSKIWRQTENKPCELNNSVKLQSKTKVSIPLSPPGSKFPILRSNMLPILDINLSCGVFELESGVTFRDLRECANNLDYGVVFTYTDKVLYWGNEKDAIKIIPNYRQVPLNRASKEITVRDIQDSSFIKGFVEEGILEEIRQNVQGVRLRKSGKSYHLVINDNYANAPHFQPLRDVVGFKGQPGKIAGFVNNHGQTKWGESIEIGLEVNGGNMYLYLSPDIWINPRSERVLHRDFLQKKRKYRFNTDAYNILNAWIKILFGGTKSKFVLNNQKANDYSPIIEISTRTAFSKRG